MRIRTKFLHPEPGRDRARFAMRNPACASPQQQRARPLTPTHTQGVDRIMRRLEEIRAELGAEIKEARSGALARAGGRPARSTVRTSAGAGRASSQSSRLYISPECNMRGWEALGAPKRSSLVSFELSCWLFPPPLSLALSHPPTHAHSDQLCRRLDALESRSATQPGPLATGGSGDSVSTAGPGTTPKTEKLGLSEKHRIKRRFLKEVRTIENLTSALWSEHARVRTQVLAL